MSARTLKIKITLSPEHASCRTTPSTHRAANDPHRKDRTSHWWPNNKKISLGLGALALLAAIGFFITSEEEKVPVPKENATRLEAAQQDLEPSAAPASQAVTPERIPPSNPIASNRSAAGDHQDTEPPQLSTKSEREKPRARLAEDVTELPIAGAIGATPSQPSAQSITVAASNAPASSPAPSTQPSVEDKIPPEPATMAHAPEKQKARTATPAQPSSKVARAQFTTRIDQREPVDNLGNLVTADRENIKRLFFFTELRELKGETVTHRWQYEGKIVADVQFKIGANRWRVYSSKYLEPSKIGAWQVIVSDANGNALQISEFRYE